MVDIEHCPACGGPPKYAEQLGNRVHCRCRDCGCDYSVETPIIETNEEDNDA